MNAKLVLLIILCLNYAYPGSAEPMEYLFSNSVDTVVIISGRVMDASDRKGIPNASILYEELPYGSYKGIAASRDESGSFEFKTFGHRAYRIVVEAGQYQIITDTINVMEEQDNGCINREYLLVPLPSEEVITLDNLIFDLGKSEIKTESFEELDNLVNLMKENPDMVIQLEGHTDFRGGKSKNLKLSEDRVKQVKNYMIHGGIMPDRILTKAYGGSKPLSWDSSEEAARLNRRVEVRIVKK
jgi:outer membrane protein OmpA-like peptidoglycan-associated protein